MRAEIVAVGSELTSGAKLDTNSQWLSLELSAAGIPVHYHTTMADDLPAMVTVLRTAAERSDLVLLTGGLGPTLDDLTRPALAELAGVDLVCDEESLRHIRALFAARQRPMPERNTAQAMLPAGGQPIPNARGTAPGVWMELPRAGRPPCLLAALPGVPSEMKPMFVEHVLPRLPGTGNVIRRHRVNCFGQGESAIEELLGDITARGHDPDVGITAHEGTITLRIDAHGVTEAECRAKTTATTAVLRERLGDLVYGEEDEELEDVLVRQLAARGQTVATAEAGTGGLLSHRLTAAAGSGACFLGGAIVPTVTARRALLGIGAESPTDELRDGDLAQAMAAGCRARLGSDFALAIVAASPADADSAAAVRPLWIALAGAAVQHVEPHYPVADPAITTSRAAKTALDLLRRHLLRSPG